MQTIFYFYHNRFEVEALIDVNSLKSSALKIQIQMICNMVQIIYVRSFIKKCSFGLDPAKNMASKENSCFWLGETLKKKIFSLKLQVQMIC